LGAGAGAGHQDFNQGLAGLQLTLILGWLQFQLPGGSGKARVSIEAVKLTAEHCCRIPAAGGGE